MVVLVVISFSAHAANWFLLASATKNGYFFFDKDSVTSASMADYTGFHPRIILWLKYVSVQKSDLGSVTSKLEFDCKDSNYRRLKSVTSINGNVVSVDNNEATEEIIPGTTYESVKGIVCEIGFPNKPNKDKYLWISGDDPEEFVKEMIAGSAK
jgi:hypothetical protein